jgi:hypothetical protein
VLSADHPNLNLACLIDVLFGKPGAAKSGNSTKIQPVQ